MSFKLFEIIFFGVLFLGGSSIVFFFLRTIWRLIKIIEPENRLVRDWMVFLLLIPGVNLLFSMWFFPMICNSVKKELEYLGRMDFSYPLKYVGIGVPLTIILVFSSVLIGSDGRLRNAIGVSRSLMHSVNFYTITFALLIFILFWAGIESYRNQIIGVRGAGKREGLRFDNSDLLDQ